MDAVAISNYKDEIEKFKLKIEEIIPELQEIIDNDKAKIDYNARYKLGKALVSYQSRILMNLRNIFNIKNQEKRRRRFYENKRQDPFPFNFEENIKMLEFLVMKGDLIEAFFFSYKILNEALSKKEKDINFQVKDVFLKVFDIRKKIEDEITNYPSLYIDYPVFNPYIKDYRKINIDKDLEEKLKKNGKLPKYKI